MKHMKGSDLYNLFAQEGASRSDEPALHWDALTNRERALFNAVAGRIQLPTKRYREQPFPEAFAVAVLRKQIQ